MSYSHKKVFRNQTNELLSSVEKKDKFINALMKELSNVLEDTELSCGCWMDMLHRKLLTAVNNSVKKSK